MENLRKTKLRTKRLTSRKYLICKPLIVLECSWMLGEGVGQRYLVSTLGSVARGVDGR